MLHLAVNLSQSTSRVLLVAYQSLYRRYRPQKFSQIKGQDHVVRALQSAVCKGQVGHAYLLYGPRGSGKTSTARVLAKALNCPNLGEDGEPCGVCESCVSIEETRSFDLQELDAASNNRVDDMRGLLERVNLTTPGRAKVYLLDEVHMLTSGAENALLKTLEEPPAHVTWVLATTEPHKVAQTIRSRCQVFELGLIDAEIMSEHLRAIVKDAELDAADELVDQAVAAGAGSVRDSLTALERIIAGGGDSELASSTDAIVNALAARDGAAALAALEEVVGRGRDPRTIGEMTLAALRHAFLTAMGNPPQRLSEHERLTAAELAERMSPAAITHALEVLGRALIEMRQAPDPRIDIEVALIRLCDSGSDSAGSDSAEADSVAALTQRIERLEDRINASNDSAVTSVSDAGTVATAAEPPQAPQAAASSSSSAAPPTAPESSTSAIRSSSSESPAAAARQTLSKRRSSASPASGPSNTPASKQVPAAPPVPVTAPDLQQIQPRSPSEVVQLAAQHLGLDREFVVLRAKELEPDQQRRREPDQLRALWLNLVAHISEPDNTVQAEVQTDASSETEPAPEVAEQPTDEPTKSDQSDQSEQPDQPGQAQQDESAQEDDNTANTATTESTDNIENSDNTAAANALNESAETPSDVQDSDTQDSDVQDITDTIGAMFPGTEFVAQSDLDSAAAS